MSKFILKVFVHIESFCLVGSKAHHFSDDLCMYIGHTYRVSGVDVVHNAHAHVCQTPGVVGQKLNYNVPFTT